MSMNFAYVAGLIDGEGCIHLDTSGRTTRARVSVGMTEPALPILTELQNQWGGTIYQQRPATERWAAAYTWHVTGEKAARIIRDIQPYLILKKPQAALALDVELVRHRLGWRRNGQKLWTDAARQECALIRERMRTLNAKGPRASAPIVEVA